MRVMERTQDRSGEELRELSMKLMMMITRGPDGYTMTRDELLYLYMYE